MQEARAKIAELESNIKELRQTHVEELAAAATHMEDLKAESKRTSAHIHDFLKEEHEVTSKAAAAAFEAKAEASMKECMAEVKMAEEIAQAKATEAKLAKKVSEEAKDAQVRAKAKADAFERLAQAVNWTVALDTDNCDRTCGNAGGICVGALLKPLQSRNIVDQAVQLAGRRCTSFSSADSPTIWDGPWIRGSDCGFSTSASWEPSCHMDTKPGGYNRICPCIHPGSPLNAISTASTCKSSSSAHSNSSASEVAAGVIEDTSAESGRGTPGLYIWMVMCAVASMVSGLVGFNKGSCYEAVRFSEQLEGQKRQVKEYNDEMGKYMNWENYKSTLGVDFGFHVWPALVMGDGEKKEKWINIKIQCSGVQHKDVHVDIIFNGCIVKLTRQASEGVEAREWVMRFQFKPSQGLFDFVEDQATLDKGYLEIFFRERPYDNRVFKFPEYFPMGKTDLDRQYEFPMSSADCESQPPVLPTPLGAGRQQPHNEGSFDSAPGRLEQHEAAAAEVCLDTRDTATSGSLISSELIDATKATLEVVKQRQRQRQLQEPSSEEVCHTENRCRGCSTRGSPQSVGTCRRSGRGRRGFDKIVLRKRAGRVCTGVSA